MPQSLPPFSQQEMEHLMSAVNEAGEDLGVERNMPGDRMANILGLSDHSPYNRAYLQVPGVEGSQPLESASEIMECINCNPATNDGPCLQIEIDAVVDSERRKIHNLFEVVPKKRASFFRIVKNVIVLKPLNVTKSLPSRLEFVPSSSILKGDRVVVFLRNALNKDSYLDYQMDSLTDNSTRCRCFNEHSTSLFCALAPRQRVEWVSYRGNPALEITVQSEVGFKVCFASLVTQWQLNRRSKCGVKRVQELVFQVVRNGLTLEQTFLLKCSAAPSRDIEPFVQSLGALGLVDPPARLAPLVAPRKEKGLYIVKIREELLSELEEKVQACGGKVYCY